MPSVFLIGIIAALCVIGINAEDTSDSSEDYDEEQNEFFNEDLETMNSFGLIPIERLVHFQLYTRNFTEKPETIKPGKLSDILKYRIKVPFKIFSHGFLESGDGITGLRSKMVVRNFLKHEDVNVIIVDWGKEARLPGYHFVARRTDDVGKYLAELIQYLVSEGAPRENFHLIGFSLGGHVVGAAGKYVQKSFKLPRITGVDPAGPAFLLAGPKRRLDPTDAEFVDVIHTCGHGYGLYKSLGHADFYVNGGTHPQPGCLPILEGVCSHLRGAYLFIHSIDPKNKYRAYKCKSIPHSKRKCTSTDYYMGNHLDTSARGLFYVETSGNPPYLKH